MTDKTIDRKLKISSNLNLTKYQGELRCSVIVSSSCLINDTRRVAVIMVIMNMERKTTFNS